MAPNQERIRQEAMENLEQITGRAETKLNDVQVQISERQIVAMIKEFAEALADFKKANAALLAATQDPKVKNTLKAEYCTKVSLAKDQLDVLYDRQETLKPAGAADDPDPADAEAARRLGAITVQL